MNLPDKMRVLRYQPAGVLRVSGPDAGGFLQSQFTNDLRNIGPGNPVYGLWLDRKGRVLADSTVLKPAAQEVFWVASVTSPGAAIAWHLGAHVIADDVQIADESADWTGAAILGAGSGDWLSSRAAAGLCFRGRRAALESWEWLVRREAKEGFGPGVAALPEISQLDAERERIAACIAAVPCDIGAADLPNEGGLDQVAISYSKGCYTGQEVMARLKSLGRIRRRLVRIRGPGAPPSPGSALWASGARQGETRSAVATAPGFEALALVAVGASAVGGRLSLSEGGPADAEVLAAS